MTDEKLCFYISASKDGLWLHSPKTNGRSECINLLMPDKHRLEQMLTSIWSCLYNDHDLAVNDGIDTNQRKEE